MGVLCLFGRLFPVFGHHNPGSGSGFTPSPDPVSVNPDPQHWFFLHTISFHRREINCKRAILFLSSSKILTPPIPLSAWRVCPPPATKAGDTHSPGGEGDGGSIFWTTREIGLPSYNDLSTVFTYNIICLLGYRYVFLFNIRSFAFINSTVTQGVLFFINRTIFPFGRVYTDGKMDSQSIQKALPVIQVCTDGRLLSLRQPPVLNYALF